MRKNIKLKIFLCTLAIFIAAANCSCSRKTEAEYFAAPDNKITAGIAEEKISEEISPENSGESVSDSEQTLENSKNFAEPDSENYADAGEEKNQENAGNEKGSADNEVSVSPEVHTVTLSVTDDTGEVFISCNVPFSDGMTVFDATKEALDNAGISFEYTGSKKNIYITGINGLFEFDRGANSGWVYYVNSEFANKGCGRYKLSQDDCIEWKYIS